MTNEMKWNSLTLVRLVLQHENDTRNQAAAVLNYPSGQFANRNSS